MSDRRVICRSVRTGIATGDIVKTPNGYAVVDDFYRDEADNFILKVEHGDDSKAEWRLEQVETTGYTEETFPYQP